MKRKRLDATLRIKYLDKIAKYLKDKFSPQKLPRLEDIYFKPRNTLLKNFHPRDLAVRLRTKLKEDNSKLEFIVVHYVKGSYFHSNFLIKHGKRKEMLDIIAKLDLEKFLIIKTDSILWPVSEGLNIIKENLNGKDLFFKLEASAESDIKKFLRKFGHVKEIKKNMAWAVAEREGLL